MLIIDESWTPAAIPVESGKLEAFYRQLTREDELSDVWQERYSASVVAQGGILVTRLRDSLYYQSGVGPMGQATYKSILVPSELWYLPRCTFKESIDSLGFFGFPGAKDRFPGAKGTSNPTESMKNFKGFLARMDVDRKLTMNRVGSSTAQYKLVKGPAFTKEEMLDVLKFNDIEFAASRENWEHREYIKTFLAHQFFVLGAF